MRPVLLALVFLAALPIHAFAWGRDGHQIVAAIATRHLSPAAQAEVTALLASEGLSGLPEVSLWADLIKALRVPDQPSHVIRLPLDHSGYIAARVCETRRCATAAIDRYAAILADRSLPIEVRVTALKYIVHLVGDVHQPLHASADTGARAVMLAGKVTTLHDVWDDDIIAGQHKGWRQLAEELDNRPPPASRGTPVDWALEGRDIARDFIFKDTRLVVGGRGDALPGLSAGYLDDNWPIVRERLQLAGWRLGALLDGALGSAANPD